MNPLNNINFSNIVQNIWSKVVSLLQQRVTYVALGAFSLLAIAYASYKRKPFQAQKTQPTWQKTLTEKAKTTGELDLGEFNLTKVQFESVINSLPPIQTIKLSNFNPPFASETISKIAPKLKELTTLDLAGVNIDDSLLKELLKECPKLETLLISGYNKLTVKGVCEACDKLTIKSLRLSEMEELTDKNISMMANQLQGIESLDLSHTDIDEQALGNLRLFQKLTKLELSGCKKMTSKGFGMISILKLTHLGLNQCAISWSTLMEILSTCPTLKSLSLNDSKILELDWIIPTLAHKTLEGMTSLSLQRASLSRSQFVNILSDLKSLENISFPDHFGAEMLPDLLTIRIQNGSLKIN